jgi:hypothetical protein
VLCTMPTSQNRDMGHPILWLGWRGYVPPFAVRLQKDEVPQSGCGYETIAIWLRLVREAVVLLRD